MLNERAAAVVAELDGAPAAADVAAVIAGRAPNVGAALLGRVRDDAEPWPERVTVPELVARAESEAARAGVPRAGCEHLVLALYALTRPAELDRTRAVVQELAADRAHAGYRALRPRDPATTPVVVAFSGLPGSGKSTLAEALGADLRAPVFSLDWLLGALTPFGLVRPDNDGPLGDHLVRAAVARQVQLGLDVVADTVLSRAGRARLHDLVHGLGGTVLDVECVCPDEAVHRARVESRARTIPGWPATVTWTHVQNVRARAEPWPEPHLTLDTTAPLETSLTHLHTALTAFR